MLNLADAKKLREDYEQGRVRPTDVKRLIDSLEIALKDVLKMAEAFPEIIQDINELHAEIRRLIEQAPDYKDLCMLAMTNLEMVTAGEVLAWINDHSEDYELGQPEDLKAIHRSLTALVEDGRLFWTCDAMGVDHFHKQ